MIMSGGPIFMHSGRNFFFRVEIYSISWFMLGKLEYPLLVYPSGRSDLDTMHTSKAPQKKKEFSYPGFEAQCQSDTENEFVSIKSQPEWFSYAVARLTGRSWNRRVRIVKSPRIREAPGGQGRRIAV